MVRMAAGYRYLEKNRPAINNVDQVHAARLGSERVPAFFLCPSVP